MTSSSKLNIQCSFCSAGQNDVKLLRADWTDKNNRILGFMSNFNRYGIPLNIIYGPKNKEGIVLPEILTKTIVINGLDELK